MLLKKDSKCITEMIIKMEVIDMNIGIIGVGGVGGYFGSKLARTKKAEDQIYFIARGEHLKKIKENGLIVRSKEEGESVCHPTLATDKISDLPMLDICLICVKAYDLENVLQELKGKIKDTTQILPLLNGIDIYERIRKVISNGYVYPACVYIGTHIGEPGVICQNGGQCKIIFGKDFNRLDSEAELLRQALETAQINFLWTKEYLEAIWSKYMCIASYALVTAAYDKTMGEVYEDKSLSEKLLAIMNVIYKLAQKKGINFPTDCINSAYQKALDFPHDTKTSFQRDYEKKRNDERQIFGQTLITLATHHNIDPTPVQEVYNKLV